MTNGQITEQDLLEYLDTIKPLVTKVSADWGSYADKIVFRNQPHSGTGLINQAGPQTPENVQIRLSATQWAGLLRKRRNPNTTPAEKHDCDTEAFGQLIHEAGHRKALVDGTANKLDHPVKEEKRNTEALINLLVDVLMQLLFKKLSNVPITGDCAGLDQESDLKFWFDRLMKVVKTQKVYRYQTCAAAHGDTVGAMARIKKELFTDFEKYLRDIKGSSLPEEKRRQYAKDKFEHLTIVTLREDLEKVQSRYAVTLSFTYDYDASKVTEKATCDETWNGKMLPVWP